MDRLAHILYLEDDAADVELVQATLESAGMACQITRVQTRDEFSAAVRQGGYDIILADFRLPMFDGIAALRQAREQCPDVPFIFVSGTMGEDAAIEGLTQGATDYVLKQKMSRLAPAVKRALRDVENRRERKRAEQALRESEERLRRLAENAQDVIYRYRLTPTLCLEYVNPAVNRILGYSPEEFYADPALLVKILHPDDQPLVQAAMLERAELEQFSVLRWVHKDGSIVWTEQRHVPIFDSAGDLLFIEGIARDITERKRAEEAVRESETRYRAIVEAFEGLIYICSQDYRVEFMNEQLLERTGYDGTGELCYKVLHDRDSICPWCVNNQVFAGETVRWEVQSPKDNHWYYVVNTPIYHTDGSISKQAMILDITERKRAEEALRQSERRKTILNQIANVFLTVPDVEMYGEVLTIVLEVMESKFGVFGFIADNGDLVVPSMTREIWSECQVPNKSMVFPSATWGDSLWGRAIREQKAFYSEGPFHIPDGHIHIDSFLTAPIVFGNKTIGLLSVANRARGYTDEDKDLLESITHYIAPILNARLQRDRQEQERKQAEEALRQANETLRATLEAAPVAILDLDTEGRVKSLWNAAAEQMLGWRRDEVLGHFLPSVPEESHEEFVRFRELIRSGKSIMGKDVVRQRKDGSPIEYSIYAAPEYDDDGKVIGNIAVLVDITERKRAEEQRRLQTTALEAAANAIVITDRGGNIQWANPAFTALTGYTIEDALGKNPRFLKSSQQDPAFYCKLWETVLAGQVWHDELVNKRKDGSLYTEEMTITPVRATGSEITHFIAIKQDVTQRKQAEAEILRHVQRLMTLQEIGRAITSTLDLDRVLVTLLEQVRQVTEAEAGSVALIEAATGDLVFRQAAGEAGQVVIGRRLRPGQGIAGWAADLRQTVMAPDAPSDPRFYGDISSGAGFVTRDLVAAPLIVRDTVIGVIEVLNKREGTFSQSDLWLIESVAAQAAVAIENARLFEETRRRLNEMAVVSYVAMVGAAGQPFDETVARATSSLSQLWPGAKVGFLFVDEADQTLRPHPSYFGMPPEMIADLRVPLNQGLTGWAVRERLPVRVGDITSDPRYVAGAADTRSEMAAPLVVGDRPAVGPTRVIGVVNVESSRPDVFSGEDLRLLATLASQLATIFEKARLDAELAQHAVMLEQRVEERTAEIRRQQARTQAILDALGEGVVVTDIRGTIQYLNPAAQALTGYGAAEVIGQNPRLWKSGRVLLGVYQEMWSTILAGRTWRGEIANRRKDGTLYDIEITVAPIPGETNGSPPAGLVGIQHDITLRKQAEEEIRKALAQEKELSDLKSRFISMASHEFRTPLGTILSSSELLEHYGSQWLAGKGLVHLRRIQAAVHHMTQLLNDVLILGKADAGKLEFNPAPMDLAQFCRDLMEEVQLGEGRRHTLHFASHGEYVGACLDEKLLRQILSNLLSNACKYSPEGSIVHFDLECREGQVIFYVRDQGIGIPPEDQARLFETFHRARNVNNIPGTGLGMAIVKKSVDLHGGTIHVASQVGVGTTFTVTLPLRVTGEA